MTANPQTLVKNCIVSLLAVAGLSGTAVAGGDSRAPAMQPLPAYTQECTACHVAYPPGMLPASSWNRLMARLDRHYGTDASLDPATVATLSAWLVAHSGTYKRTSEEPPQERITLSQWFIRKHREVSPATWKRPSVKSAANCAACHPQAEQGNFNEHSIRIPR